MADRSVRVSLILAAQGFMSGMDAVAQKTARTGSELDKLNQKKQAFTELGAGALGFGAAVGVGVGMAISRFAEFDQQMSYVQAATHETAANMNLLRDAALEAGARTVYSATEAAGAIEELAKAGVSTSDILSGGLDAALDLAAAGGLDVAEAAGIAATALKTFNLQGEDMSHVADLLAAGAGKAMGDVSELSQALAQGGQVAKSTGLSIEETTAGLAAFAAQGLRGSDAGTSFKSMLQRLTPQSAEAQREMDRLGISAYDAQGQFIGLSEFAGNLQQSLRDLTPEQRNAAMATIFGADAVRAANVLYQEGADGIDKWTDAVNDQGYAAQTAAMRLDNLMGDVEQLGGAFDTALIQSGSGANDTLRALVQTVTGAVGMFADLPEPIQQTALYLGIAASAVGLVGGAALLATPRVAQFRAIVSAAGLSMKGLSLAAGGVTLGLAGVLALVAAFASRQAEASAAAEEFATTLDDLTGAATDNTRAMIVKKLADRDAFQGAKEAGIGQKELADALYEGGDAVEALRKRMYDFANANPLNPNIASSVNALNDLEGQLAGAKERHDDMSAAAEDNAESTQTAADAYLAAAGGAEDLDAQLRDLIDTINEANGLGQDAVTTNADYQAALAGIAEEVQRQKDAFEELHGTVDGFTLSLDEGTVSGSANASMLADVAGKAQDAALAQLEVDRATMGSDAAAEKYAATLAAQRQAFIDSAIEAGYNAEEVQTLADKVFALPSAKEIDILADTGPATAAINGFITSQSGRRIVLRVMADNSQGYSFDGGRTFAQADGGKVEFFANGGRSENHVAQYARAGDWRVWAEPETGGEWYLPDAKSKRDRSLGIAQQMLGGWGYQIVPLGAQQYAAGAPVHAPAHWQAAPAHMTAPAPVAAASAPPVQHVHETIQLTAPNGRVLFETLREYTRSG